jgi:hypothetical protein
MFVTIIVHNVRVNVNIYLLFCMYFRVLIVVKLGYLIGKTKKEGGYVSSVVEFTSNLPLFFGSCFNSSVFKTIFSILYLSLLVAFFLIVITKKHRWGVYCLCGSFLITGGLLILLRLSCYFHYR